MGVSISLRLSLYIVVANCGALNAFDGAFMFNVTVNENCPLQTLKGPSMAFERALIIGKNEA